MVSVHRLGPMILTSIQCATESHAHIGHPHLIFILFILFTSFSLLRKWQMPMWTLLSLIYIYGSITPRIWYKFLHFITLLLRVYFTHLYIPLQCPGAWSLLWLPKYYYYYLQRKTAETQAMPTQLFWFFLVYCWCHYNGYAHTKSLGPRVGGYI